MRIHCFCKKVSKFKEQEEIILDDEENSTSEELSDNPDTN